MLYVPGEYCYPAAGEPRCKNTIRLSFGVPSVEQLGQGVAALARAIVRCGAAQFTGSNPIVSSTTPKTAPGGMLRLLIVDRYLLRQFVQTFLICFCSLTGLYIVIDGFANLEEFINYGQKEGGLLKVMGEYYSYRTLSFFDGMSHILTLIAAMFTMTWIQRHNELTALEAAGLPKSRIVRPLITGTLVIIAVSVFNREFVIPHFRNQLSHNAQDLGGSTGKPLVPRYDNETDVLLGGSASKTYADELRIHRPDFYLPQGLDRYGTRVTAENAFYRAARGRPAGRIPVRKSRTAQERRRAAIAFAGRTADIADAARHPVAQARRVLCGQQRQLRALGRRHVLAAVFQHDRAHPGVAKSEPGFRRRRAAGNPCPHGAADAAT